MKEITILWSYRNFWKPRNESWTCSGRKVYANGATSRFVLTMDASEGADGLVATEDIQSLDDLAGKKVALDKSASSYYFFLTALEKESSLTEEILM